MSRSADYSIQGFLYQFNKTALEILKCHDDELIVVEGVIEDIDIHSGATTTAIQCKYHEGKGRFSPSDIYKPILQMAVNYFANPSADVSYVLFVCFPTTSGSIPPISREIVQAALDSKDKKLEKYIRKVPAHSDIDAFIKHVRMELGPSYDSVVAEVFIALANSGFPKGEIEALAYPNAIHIVGATSIKHEPDDRRITRKEFLQRLREIRKTAISRWTLALRTRAELLKARRRQLKSQLDKNTRLRYFVINPRELDDYDADIVQFVQGYVEKYHFKPTHISTPLMCICSTWQDTQALIERLYSKGITATDGYVGSKFEESHFFRTPLKQKGPGGEIRREFMVRILTWEENGRVMNNRKCDDLFLIGDPKCESLEIADINVEQLSGVTMKELKYMLGISSNYE